MLSNHTFVHYKILTPWREDFVVGRFPNGVIDQTLDLVHGDMRTI